MPFPYITALTTALVLLLQIVLAFAVSGGRGKLGTWIGDGGHASLQRATRRHANLAENAGLFMVGFALLELSRFSPRLLVVLCAAFVVARLLHAAGLSRENTGNLLRIAGGVGTYLIGFVLAGALGWAAIAAGA
ncbi:MAPEG family protein [Paucibacter sp. R3-3]|uniref:MAPEG family protein n=1 Tax=Roseateles agri TaxID=3098619 RepID=A0ABU5DTC5_9BURK|nr:MAPEG family protein [Paucibacter sp. R3-3]MDY0748452.1 MAPEG family protein [Paucibacter sp. R3-3]